MNLRQLNSIQYKTPFVARSLIFYLSPSFSRRLTVTSKGTKQLISSFNWRNDGDVQGRGRQLIFALDFAMQIQRVYVLLCANIVDVNQDLYERRGRI